jgi:penicillin-binding protein 1C
MSYHDDKFDRRAASLPPAMPPVTPGAPQGAPSGMPQSGPVYGLQYAQARPVRRRRRIPRGCLGCLLALIGFLGVVSCVTVVILVIWLNALSGQLTDRLDKAQRQMEQQTFQTTRIYDRLGNELHQIFDQGRRTKVKLADVPKSLIDATIAVEDSSFYENPGVDWTATIRAGLQYLGLMQGSSGGGTITQQLIRDIAFDYAYRQERSVQRKLEEIGMALILTRQKSKDDILEMYLNQIYYGNLAYGIEAAAQTYFGKSAKDLTLGESALLAGLPQAPAELDPLNPDPTVQEEVLARRKIVLSLMVDKGKITRDEAAAAEAKPLVYANPNVSLRSPHFTLYAEQELKSLLEGLKLPPSLVTTGGLKVYTTLDARYQSLAESVARQQIAAIKDQHNAHNAAVVILKPASGEILAMMGSVDFNDVAIKGQVNVAISPKQPGSAIKPLTYAAAMEKGFTAASIIWDVEAHIRAPGLDYSPVNYDRRFHGPVRLRDALANSYNIPAVQTLRTVGVDYLLSMAQRFRITSLGTDASKYGLSLTLGGGELTPLELTQAFAVFANGGQLVSATSILCIINNDGNVLYQYEGGCEGRGVQDAATINAAASPKAVLDPRVAFVISDILADNAARTPAMGPNSPLRTEGLVTSVKTGTTNDYRDNWTVGFTHNVAVGVWVGNTDSTPMVNSSGLTGAAPIWHDIITGIYGNPSMLDTLKRAGSLIPDVLNPPPGLYRKQLCNLAALKDPAMTCPPGRAEWFLDSPAAVPDANGKLTIPPGVRPAAPTPIPPNANGPIIIDVEPGIVQTLVQPLDPGLAASLVRQPGAGLPALPPPLYCLVPNEVKDQIPTASMQFFIRPPSRPDEEAYARIYAQNYGYAILPDLPCTPEMLVTGPQAPGATARITSPRPGETVTGTVLVSGVANWQPGQATFFKTEIQGPQFPQWVTFGDVQHTPVINGPLGQFGASGLQPGTYKLRLIIVGLDGNFLVVSSEVPINITGQ